MRTVHVRSLYSIFLHVMRQPLVLARYPDIGSDGKPQFMNIAKVINSSNQFQYNNSRQVSVPVVWLSLLASTVGEPGLSNHLL